MHALSGCDTASYLFDKERVTALNNMISGNYEGLATTCDIGTTHTELMKTAMPFLVAFYSQPLEQSWNLLATLYLQSRGKGLPPTSINVLQHILWAHTPAMLWKKAHCERFSR